MVIDLNKFGRETEYLIEGLYVKAKPNNYFELSGNFDNKHIVGSCNRLRIIANYCDNINIELNNGDIGIENARCGIMNIKTTGDIELYAVQSKYAQLKAMGIKIYASNITDEANIECEELEFFNACCNRVNVKCNNVINITQTIKNLINELTVYAKSIKLNKTDDEGESNLGQARLVAEESIILNINRKNIVSSEAIIEAIAPEINIYGYYTNTRLICKGNVDTSKAYNIENGELIVYSGIASHLIKEKFESIKLECDGGLLLSNNERVVIENLTIKSNLVRIHRTRIAGVYGGEEIVVNNAVILDDTRSLKGFNGITVKYGTLGYDMNRTYDMNWNVMDIPKELIAKQRKLDMLGINESETLLNTLRSEGNKNSDTRKLKVQCIAELVQDKFVKSNKDVEIDYVNVKIIELFRQLGSVEIKDEYKDYLDNSADRLKLIQERNGVVIGAYKNYLMFSVRVGDVNWLIGNNTSLALEIGDAFYKIRHIKKVGNFKVIDIEDALRYKNGTALLYNSVKVIEKRKMICIAIGKITRKLLVLTSRGWVEYKAHVRDDELIDIERIGFI